VALSEGNSVFFPLGDLRQQKTILGLAGMENCCPRIGRGFSATMTVGINQGKTFLSLCCLRKVTYVVPVCSISIAGGIIIVNVKKIESRLFFLLSEKI
jgi:hypothetical protein